MRWLRFAIGLLIALTLHSLLDNFFPNALAFFDPYVILVVYYSMGGNLVGAIIAGVTAGIVQDAFSSAAIFGLHAFALTVCAYLVAYINSRLVLRGTLAFGGSLIGSVILNEIVIYVLVNILLKQRIELFEEGLLAKTVLTSLFGMLVYQLLTLFLAEEPIEATKRPTGW